MDHQHLPLLDNPPIQGPTTDRLDQVNQAALTQVHQVSQTHRAVTLLLQELRVVILVQAVPEVHTQVRPSQVLHLLHRAITLEPQVASQVPALTPDRPSLMICHLTLENKPVFHKRGVI